MHSARSSSHIRNRGVPDRGGPLANHKGPGNEVPQTLALRVEHGCDDADAVKARELIDDTQQVSADNFKRVQGTPGLLDDPDSGGAFARCLSVPEDFEKREVAEVQKEGEHDDSGCEPKGSLRERSWEAKADEERHGDGQDDAGGELDQGVDGEREEAASDAGDIELQIDLLGCFDDVAITLGERFERRRGRLMRRHDLKPVD